jgi:phosphonate transport system substrate-binding protein
LSQRLGIPVKGYIASDYAGVIEALRSKNIDLAFVPPVGYVVASREAGCRIIAKDVWCGKTSFTGRSWVHYESHMQSLEELRGEDCCLHRSRIQLQVYLAHGHAHQGRLGRRPRSQDFCRDVLFAGSHDAALLALLNRHVDATASFDTAPEQYLNNPCRSDPTKQGLDEERIRWLSHVAEAEPIPETGISGRADRDSDMSRKVCDVLYEL